MAAVIGLLLGLLAAPGTARAATITYTYQVRGWDNVGSLEDFAARAAQTYAHPAGWGLGGSITFVRVPSGGNFTLWLSAPQHLPAFSSGCSATYSCRVGRNVIINEARFRTGTASWNATGASLRDYQHMVVNHETGHWLGFGHSSCPGTGRPAPVMQQQSKSMQGCRPNAWPTASERSTLARWRGVPIRQPAPPQSSPPLIPAGTVVSVPVAGTRGIPGDAVAVGVNVTVTRPAGRGYLTVFPCGSPVPPTSNLNFAAGQTIAAFTLAAPGASGAVCVRTSQATHLVVDASGYVPAGATYSAVGPARLLDTRTAGGAASASTRAVQLPAGSHAAALTVTATAATAAGHVTVYPCDRPQPSASTVNFTAGSSVANLSLAAASPDGRICLSPNAPAHLVVDLVGTFPDGSGFAAAPPQRLLDSRTGPGRITSTELPLPEGGLHALNLTVTQPVGPGWARMFPCGSEPGTSNINFTAGQTVANAFPAQAAASGKVCIRSSAPAHIVVDDGGVLGPDEYAPVPPVRLLDSRQR